MSEREVLPNLEEIAEICGLMAGRKARESIAEDVVNHCRKHPDREECRLFNAFLQKLPLKGGFRDPKTAPVGALVRKIMNMQPSPFFFEMILPVWPDADTPIHRSCREMWKDLSADTRLRLRKQIAEKEIRELSEIADDLRGRTGINDKALILFALCAFAMEYFDETEEETSETEDMCDFWNDVTVKLLDLPSDGIEWRQLERFFQWAVEIRERKRQSETRKSREAELEEAIGNLMDTADGKLALLGLEAPGNLSFSDISVAAIDEALEWPAQIEALIDAYSETEDQTLKRPASKEEKDLREKAFHELNRIESEIKSVYRQLLGIFPGAGEGETEREADPPSVEFPAEEAVETAETAVEDSFPDEVPADVHDMGQGDGPSADLPSSADQGDEKDGQTIPEAAAAESAAPVPDTAEEPQTAAAPAENDLPQMEAAALQTQDIEDEETAGEGDGNEAEMPLPAAEADDGPAAPDSPPAAPAEADETETDAALPEDEGPDAETDEDAADTSPLPASDTGPDASAAPDPEIFLQITLKDDLAAGYWLSKSFENSGLNPPVPSWMFEALAGARMLGWDSDDFVGDLLNITIKHSPDDDEIQKIFGTAAALRSSLMAPASGMVSWLKTSRRIPQIQPLVEAVEAFAGRQYPLKQEDLSGVDGKEERENRILKIVEKAETFVRESATKDLKYQAATRIWRNLIGERGPLREMLRPVMEDSRSRKKDVEGYLRNWRREEFITKKINDWMKNRYNIQQEIVGSPRKHLFELIHQSTSIAAGWIDMVEREAVFRNRSKWLTEQIVLLKNAVEEAAPGIFAALLEMDSDAASLRERIAARVFGRSLVQLYFERP